MHLLLLCVCVVASELACTPNMFCTICNTVTEATERVTAQVAQQGLTFDIKLRQKQLQVNKANLWLRLELDGAETMAIFKT